MASLARKSGDTFCRLLKEKSVTPHNLVNIVKNILFGRSYYLILDDTIIEKTYAKLFQGACDNYNTSNSQIVHSLCSTAAMISDGKRVIPKAFAKKHVQIYGFRWNIEKFFRTDKQYLGLTHCQLRSKNAQENHIFNVFFAYALLQFETKKFGLKNPESAAKQLKRRKYPF